MKFRFIYLFVAVFLFTGCEKVPQSYDEVYDLFVTKQWDLNYIMEDRGKGPVLYNDNFNTTTLLFNPNKTLFVEVSGKEYVGTWGLETVKSSLHLSIDIPDLEYISKDWIITDIYGWGYEEIRVIVKTYDFSRGINMEMGLN